MPFSSLNPQSRLTPRRGFWPALTGACLFTFSLLAAGAALAGDSQKTAGFIAEDLGRASLKQAIRNQLDAEREHVAQSVKRHTLKVGLQDLTRADLDLPVVRALVPGMELSGDLDRFARVHPRLYGHYLKFASGG